MIVKLLKPKSTTFVKYLIFGQVQCSTHLPIVGLVRRNFNRVLHLPRYTQAIACTLVSYYIADIRGLLYVHTCILLYCRYTWAIVCTLVSHYIVCTLVSYYIADIRRLLCAHLYPIILPIYVGYCVHTCILLYCRYTWAIVCTHVSYYIADIRRLLRAHLYPISYIARH